MQTLLLRKKSKTVGQAPRKLEHEHAGPEAMRMTLGRSVPADADAKSLAGPHYANFPKRCGVSRKVIDFLGKREKIAKR